MQEIADWLKKLGMSEYTQRFAKERVDFSVLAELTDQHLKDLGLPLGDRLKMLRAIHELADPIPASPQQVGDALMSLFGYPIAHDNDAERAARAALGIQRAFDELNRKNAGAERLAVRIGVDTGPAVIDAAGEIYGDVANIAARVQALADPGEVVVTARVQHQIAGLFVAESCGTHTLKGVLEPTAVFRLVRASGGGRRSAQRQLTPLVGRGEEIAMLLRHWERARHGDGQLVLIVGEPGLGKSRLIEEFHRRVRDAPHT